MQTARRANLGVCFTSLSLPQFDEDEDDWLVHEDEEEGAPGAKQRRRRRRAGLEGMPGVDADALEVRTPAVPCLFRSRLVVCL